MTNLATIRSIVTGSALFISCLLGACGGGRSATVSPADGLAVVGAASAGSAPGTPASGAAPIVVAAALTTSASSPSMVGMVTVDATRIPAALNGIATLNVANTDEVAPAGAGAFRTVCTFAHMSFDDPIVFPGQPGRSHLHTFFGNTGANANSTPESLRSTGNSTCRGGIANRSAYWVPTMIDTLDNTPIVADEISVYYKNGELDATQVRPIPTGLRMIAGDPTASAPHPDVFSMRWKCIGGPNNENDQYQLSIPNCDVGAQVFQEIFFPQCWDSVNLDAPDHMSHMSYPVQVKNDNDPRGWFHPECPVTHPVILPQISFNVMYTVKAKDAPLHWRLSSDNYDRSKPAGYSSHGDWFNGWKGDISDAWAKNCIESLKDCHSHLLGDGRMIY